MADLILHEGTRRVPTITRGAERRRAVHRVAAAAGPGVDLEIVGMHPMAGRAR